MTNAHTTCTIADVLDLRPGDIVSATADGTGPFLTVDAIRVQDITTILTLRRNDMPDEDTFDLLVDNDDRVARFVRPTPVAGA